MIIQWISLLRILRSNSPRDGKLREGYNVLERKWVLLNQRHTGNRMQVQRLAGDIRRSKTGICVHLQRDLTNISQNNWIYLKCHRETRLYAIVSQMFPKCRWGWRKLLPPVLIRWIYHRLVYFDQIVAFSRVSTLLIIPGTNRTDGWHGTTWR